MCPRNTIAARPKPRAIQRAFLASDAPHGILKTLRARWLAAHRQLLFHGPGTAALHRPAIPACPLTMIPEPEIAAGMGERPRSAQMLMSLAPLPLANIAAIESPVPADQPAGTLCFSEEVSRIRNYAARAIEGIAASPNEDLNLFLADGRAGAALPSPSR